MMDSAHTGFRNWDDNDWTYPQIRMVNPIPRGKIVVSFRGNSALERTGMFMENELSLIHISSMELLVQLTLFTILPMSCYSRKRQKLGLRDMK